MISYAQNLEDLVLNRAFQNKPTGFYIDVGAHDPVELSVTKLFYDLGWRGINIEPVPKSYEKFEINRPDDINLNIALGAKHDFLSIYEIENHPEYTSMNKKIAETSGELTGSKVIRSTIETRTLKEVCDQHCDSFIDFIKIDVEGFEQEVILGADFTKYRPTMIVIEATRPCKAVIEDWENIDAEAAWHDWEPLLFKSKYLLVYFDGLNRYYLRKEDEHLKKYFEIPITLVQDNFTLYSTVKEIDILKSNNTNLEERSRELKEQFEKASEEHLLLKKASEDKQNLINSKIKANTKLKGKNQELKNKLGDRQREYELLKACLGESELKLKQALEDKNKLKDKTGQIEGELRSRRKECESLKAFLSEKDLNLKQAMKEFHKIKYEYSILNACVNQKNLRSRQKKWLRLFDLFQIFFDLKENSIIPEFKINIEKPDSAFETEVTKRNVNIESNMSSPSIFFHNWEKISNIIREEIVKKGYELILETEKFFHIKYSLPQIEWIGICHIPFELPNWMINTKAYLPYSKWLTSSDAWSAAKTNCNSLIAFSNDHSEKIQSKTGIKANVIKIPNYEISEKWTWEAFESNSAKSIVQVGWWLMRMHAIYCLPGSAYSKVWIYDPDSNMDDVFNMEREYLKKRNLFYNFMDESVLVNNHLTAKNYAGIMRSNIAFIHYYAVSVPDFVLECIARNTPILVNPLPAVREYLGDEYPLYYYFYNDAVTKAEDKKLVKDAHEFLCELDGKSELSPGGIQTQIHSFVKGIK